jgi:hypothetical protein
MEDQELGFKGQMKYENFQFFFRRHWVKFLQPFFFTLPIVLSIFVILVMLGRITLMVDLVFVRIFYVLFAMLLAIGCIEIFFLQLINFYFYLVIVTDCRILVIRKTVFLRNNSDAVDLTKIQDIAVEAHGLLRNYLKYGALLITLSTSGPPVTIAYVPDPHFYLEWTNRVKREHIVLRQEKKKTEAASKKQDEYLQDISSLPAS